MPVIQSSSSTPLCCILENLKNVRPPSESQEDKKIREMRMLPDDERLGHVMEWRYQGISISAIAKIFGVNSRTVSTWISQSKEKFRQSFEGETAADILAGHWQFLDYIESVCLYEAHQLGSDSKQIDPKTGKVIDRQETVTMRAARNRCLESAMRARKMKIDLHLQTGVLPKEPSRMYHTLEQEGRVDDSSKNAPQRNKTRDQLVTQLLEQLEKSPLDIQ